MRFDGSDFLIILGFACLLTGLWWLMPAVSLIVGGLGLMLVGLLRAMRAEARQTPAVSDRGEAS